MPDGVRACSSACVGEIRLEEGFHLREFVQRLAVATLHHQMLGRMAETMRFQPLHHRIAHFLRWPHLVLRGGHELDRTVDPLDRDRNPDQQAQLLQAFEKTLREKMVPMARRLLGTVVE